MIQRLLLGVMLSFFISSMLIYILGNSGEDN